MASLIDIIETNCYPSCSDKAIRVHALRHEQSWKQFFLNTQDILNVQISQQGSSRAGKCSEQRTAWRLRGAALTKSDSVLWGSRQVTLRQTNIYLCCTVGSNLSATPHSSGAVLHHTTVPAVHSEPTGRQHAHLWRTPVQSKPMWAKRTGWVTRPREPQPSHRLHQIQPDILTLQNRNLPRPPSLEIIQRLLNDHR